MSRILIGRSHTVGRLGVGEYKLVVHASALAFGMLAILFLVLRVDFAAEYFLLALPVGLGALVLDRWLWRKWLLRQRAFGHYLARAIVVGRRSPLSLYDTKLASFAMKDYDVTAARGFIDLFGLPMKVRGMKQGRGRRTR